MIWTAIDQQVWGTSVEEASAWPRKTQNGSPVEAETILLVEDEAFVREVTGEVQRSAGYRVLCARDAAEARRAYEAHGGELDLLLTDVILPGETGRALAARLRREIPGIKVLLISGYAKQMGLQVQGSEECLAKPFSARVLLRKVRKVLDGDEPLGGEGDGITHDRGSE